MLGSGIGALLGKGLLKAGEKVIVNKAAEQFISKELDGAIVLDSEAIFIKYERYIFSSDHVKHGIENIGNSRKEIFDNIVNIINENKSSLEQANNQLRTVINGYEVEIKAFVKDGKVVSIDAQIGYSNWIPGSANIINVGK